MIILPHLLHVFLLNLITSFQLHNWDASRSVVKYTHSHLYNVNFTPSVVKQFNFPIQSKFDAIILSENKVKQNNYCHCATICVCDTTENYVGSIYRPGRVRNGYSMWTSVTIYTQLAVHRLTAPNPLKWIDISRFVVKQTISNVFMRSFIYVLKYSID